MSRNTRKIANAKTRKARKRLELLTVATQELETRLGLLQTAEALAGEFGARPAAPSPWPIVSLHVAPGVIVDVSPVNDIKITADAFLLRPLCKVFNAGSRHVRFTIERGGEPDTVVLRVVKI